MADPQTPPDQARTVQLPADATQALDASGDPPPGVTPTPAPPPPRQWRRRLGWALGGTLALLVALAVLLAVAWRSSATLPWVLDRVPGLQAEGVQGSLSGRGATIERLTWDLPSGGRLELRELALRGVGVSVQPRPGAWASLSIEALSIAALAHRSASSPAAPSSGPPTDISSPVDLRIAKLTVGRLDVQGAPAMSGLQGSLEVGADAGAAHRAQVDQVQLYPQRIADGLLATDETAAAPLARAGAAPLGFDLGGPVRASGTLALATAAPLTLKADVEATGAEGRAWQAKASAQGPLTRLGLSLKLDAAPVGTAAAGMARRPVMLSAEATVQPWQAWPLADLKLSTRSLDLSALAAGWPRTDIDAQADVRSAGLDQPAHVDLTLTNRLPGRLDAGALPLRSAQLQAGAVPESPDALTLQRFDLRLGDARGPAGQVSGQGRWHQGDLRLVLQADNLEPARLDARAAPMQLSGPLTVTGRGLGGDAGTAWQMAWQGELKGHPLPRQGPDVAVLTRGEAQEGDVRLTSTRLSAGAASAEVSGRLQWSASRWSVTAQGRVADFDPAPWWRAAPAASQPGTGAPEAPVSLAPAWPPGATRLNAQFSTEMAGNGPLQSLAGASPREVLARLGGQAALTLSPSVIGQTPLQGEFKAQGQGLDLQVSGQLDVDGQRLQASAGAAWLVGEPAPGQPVQARWQTPALERLAPWRRWAVQRWPALAEAWPLSGRSDGQLTWRAGQATGPLAAWLAGGQIEGQARLSALRWPALSLAQGSLDWSLGSAADAPMRLALALDDARTLDGTAPAASRRPARDPSSQPPTAGTTASNTSRAPSRRAAAAPTPSPTATSTSSSPANSLRLDRLRLTLDGTAGDHRVSLRLLSPLRPPAAAESLLGDAGDGTDLAFDGAGQWLSAAAGSEWRLRNADVRVAARRSGTAAPTGRGPVASASANADTRAASTASATAAEWLKATGLSATVRLSRDGLSLQGVHLEPGALQLAQTTALRWTAIDWQPDAALPGGRWAVDATLDRFDVARLLARLQPGVGWGGNLSVGGRVQWRRQGALQAEVVLERLGGDLTLTDELGQTVALGLSDLRLTTTVRDGQWQFAQGLAGRALGTVVGGQVIQSTPSALWPRATDRLQGVVQARVGNLAAWSAWVPPGWRLSGALDAEMQLAGQFGAPLLQGRMDGRELGLRNLLEGVSLSGGELAVALQGDTLQVERLRFDAGDGSVALTGTATLGAKPQANLKLVADKARVLARIDRRIVASGQADVLLDAERLKVDGRFQVDQGQVDISQGSAPSLDSDVVVHRRNAPAAADATASAPPAPQPQVLRNAQVRVVLDLGQRLRLSGLGVDTRLAGELTLTTPGGVLQLQGTVRSVDGRYQAYGQKLEIGRGEVIFSGPVANPRLDVLAIRPNLDVQVGVAITGTAQNPQVRLYSDTDLSDYDKLSWLVLGRSPDGLASADTALLQRAAIGLLSGSNGPGPTDQLFSALGISEFSLRQSENDTRDTVISLGRQLSRRWYVGYERSVNATTGTWQLIYRVAQRFTLRAQSGSSDNAVDVIWTWRW